ncbi:MAG: molecular chaperone DnaK [Chloroflexi bacterium]|nr:molecular chaperone DnaK [Chloroflexota bacterium]
MEKNLGISLGLSNSVTAVVVKDKPIAIPSAEGQRVVPAFVAVDKHHERLVGQMAWQQARINPKNTIFHIQHLMGRKFADPEVQRLISSLPYELTEASNGDVHVILDGKEYAPTELSAMLLHKHKKDSEERLGQSFSGAVITVPAYFNSEQRNATKEAGQLAGFEVLNIIDEPIAACLAYGFNKTKDAIIMVYDFGGGTFNASVLIVKNGNFTIKSNKVDLFLGGNDFDQRLLDYLTEEFWRENRIDLQQDRQALLRLGEAAEKAKKELSKNEETVITLPFLSANASGPKHLETTLARNKLEYLTGDLIDRSLKIVENAIQDADLEIKDIDEVVLVGGMARMPTIERAVRTMFQKEPYKNCPDEIVALGAAIKAIVSTEEMQDILYLDVTPLSLGIRTNCGLCRTLIERNTTIPCKSSLIFSTVADFQTKMTIQLLQGENLLADRNQSLGQFTMTGLPSAAQGSVQVKVDFSIDINGILNVSACDLVTGAVQQVTTKPGQGLSVEEINRLVANTKQLEHDATANQKVNALRSARRLAYVATNIERDLSTRISPLLFQQLHSALSQLNETLKNQSADLGVANNLLGQLLSVIFLALETSGPMPPRKKGQVIQRASPAGREKLLTGFHTLENRSGGMGSVMIVSKEGQIFAVKTPRSELLENPLAISRFLTEARTWIGLERHSNIVCALLVREAFGQPYLFLEYADAGNLEQWLGKLPIAQVLDYAIQICTGMSYAFHKAGIVHRDIKPANILLSKGDQFRFCYSVKVTDFGLAGVWKKPASDNLDTIETQMSSGMGTWPYMPPEQFSKDIQIQFGFSPQPVTVRSDIYSFGVLLYELLMGTRPYLSVKEIFSSSPHPPRIKNGGCSKKLSALILRCMDSSPDQRFASFEEIRTELIRIYQQQTHESYTVIGGPAELTYLDWTARGASLVALGDYQEGLRSFEKALTLVQEFPVAWQGKGQCLEYSELFDQALPCYEKAIQINPYQEEALLGIARCFNQKNRFGEAIAYYERAYEAQLLTSIGPD